MSIFATIAAVLMAVGAIGSGGSVFGQTWDGTVSGSWMNKFNWTTNVAPVSGAGTAIIMSTATNTTTTQDIVNPLMLNSLTFAGPPGPPPAAGAFTISGSALNFVNTAAGAAPTITNNSANLQTIAAPLSLTNNLTFNGTGNLQVQVTGVISETAVSSVTVNATGGVSLAAANTFSGGTTLTAGTLILGNNAAVGNAKGTLSLNGGTVRATKQTSVVIPNPVSFGGNVGLGTTDTTKTMTFTGNSTFSQNLTWTLGGPITNFNGNIDSNKNNLTIAGTGQVSTGGTVNIPATTVTTGTVWNKGTWNGNVTVTNKSGFWKGSNGAKLNGAISTQDGVVSPGGILYDDTTGITTDYPGVDTATSMSLDPGGEFQWLFDGQSAGDGFGFYSQMDIAGGSLVLGNATLDVDELGVTSLPIVGQTYTLIDNESLSPVVGTFGSLPQDTIFTDPDGYQWQISYTGGDGNDVTLTSVPEPTGLGILVIGSVLAARRRRA